jgi:hypothetical protein
MATEIETEIEAEAAAAVTMRMMEIAETVLRDHYICIFTKGMRGWA